MEAFEREYPDKNDHLSEKNESTYRPNRPQITYILNVPRDTCQSVLSGNIDMALNFYEGFARVCHFTMKAIGMIDR